MNLPTLASFIRTLTHRVDTLECICSKVHRILPITASDLANEIVMLHNLLDDLNAAYTEMEEAVAETAFENAGR